MIARSSPALTTDYLNHFGELVMLLEMAFDQPEAMDDIREWRPRSYLEHIGAMRSATGDIYRHGYAHVDPERRALLQETAANANRLGSAIVAALCDPMTRKERAEGILHLGCGVMHAHIRRLSAIISGKPLAHVDMPEQDAQAEIDDLLAQAG